MAEHLIAIRAAARDTTGVPNCPDWRLRKAEEAGLIRFRGWPSGHWQVTDAGFGYMTLLEEEV